MPARTLTPQDWRFVEDAAVAAWDLPVEERESFLTKWCAERPDLLREAKALARARDASINWRAPQSAAPPARRFGVYEIERLIGRGGMGAVYLAHRADGSFKHKVAVKVVGLPFEIEAVRERFRRERQILAELNHPNITHVIDGGITADGELYLAMEYVDGMPIDEYAKAHKLTEGARLDLFRQVTSAVAYAHQNLIVHRDLKPSNILVTPAGVIKLLDFGTAKILGAEATEATATAILTVGYASPEHLRGQAATTLSDVYSLGVVLYELLSGKKAFGSDLVTRLESESALPQLPGDLGQIVAKALAQNPVERYASVEQFGEDVRRCLAGEPVLAHPAAWSYRAGKFLRRHAWASAAAGVFVAGLAGATIFALRQASIAREQAESARKVAEFTTQTLMSSSPHLNSPLARKSGPITMLDVLDNAAERVGPQLGANPVNEADMLRAIAHAYELLGETVKAEKLVDRAMAIGTKLGPSYENGMVALLEIKCNLYNMRSDYQSARRWCQQAVDLVKRSSNPDPGRIGGTRYNLAFMMFQDGAPVKEVEALYREGCAHTGKFAGLASPAYLQCLARIAEMRMRAGDNAEAEKLLRVSLEGMHRVPGPPLEIVGTLRALAALKRRQGNYAEAQRLLEEALQVLTVKPAPFYSRLQFETELLYAEALAGHRALESRARELLKATESDVEIRARRAMITGLVFARAGDRRAAEPLLKQAVQFYQTRPNRELEHGESESALAVLK